MSETRLQTGKFKKIGEMTPEGVEDYCKDMCKSFSPEKYEDVIQNGFKCYEHSWLEVLNDEFWKSDEHHKDEILYINGVVYKIYDVENHDADGFFFHKEQIGDGEYKFTTQYYDGGTCLSEIIEEEIENLS